MTSESLADVLAWIDGLKRAKQTPSMWALDELDTAVTRLNSADTTGIDRPLLERVETTARWLRDFYAAKYRNDPHIFVPRWDNLIRLGSRRGPWTEKQESLAL